MFLIPWDDEVMLLARTNYPHVIPKLVVPNFLTGESNFLKSGIFISLVIAQFAPNR
jgi:hypothetical protein